MKGVSVGGHRYSDPDVLSLIYNDGGLIDPRLEVLRKARSLNERLRSLGGNISDPRERIKILASLADIKVSAMTNSSKASRGCDALLYRDSGGSRRAVYDESYPNGRANFSIAHEIAHSFFPNSSNGVRFRSFHKEQSREANEIERLCDLGASELLMPQDELLQEIDNDYGLQLVPRLAIRFGSSYEATVFRLASAFRGLAIAGLLQFRYRMAEERRRESATQFELFSNAASITELPEPKYRRQSLHTSLSCGREHMIPWNKSFDRTSCVYLASEGDRIRRGQELLPNSSGEIGHIEAVCAPYQRTLREDRVPDVLFLWWQ